MSSAAARVFGIAELLENILLHVADLKSEETRGDPSYRPPSPITQLFLLQRVDRTFNVNIRHSKKLARFMFLANLPDSNNPDMEIYERYAPLYWLLDFLGRQTDAEWAAAVNLKEENSKGLICPFIKYSEKWVESEYIKTRAERGPSWRDMRVSNVTSAEESKTVSFEYTRIGDLMKDWLEAEVTKAYEIGSDMTLGEFFDLFVEAREELRAKLES